MTVKMSETVAVRVCRVPPSPSSAVVVGDRPLVGAGIGFAWLDLRRVLNQSCGLKGMIVREIASLQTHRRWNTSTKKTTKHPQTHTRNSDPHDR